MSDSGAIYPAGIRGMMDAFNRTVINESALRDMLREAVGNVGAMGQDSDEPIVPNPSLDRATIQIDLDPDEADVLPKTHEDLHIMVRNLLDGVQDDVIPELYVKIKQMCDKVDHGIEGQPMDLSREESNEMKESKLVGTIRKLISEEIGKLHSKEETAEEEDLDDEMTDVEDEKSFWDPEPLPAEKKPTKKHMGSIGQVEGGATFDVIASELGFTNPGAKKAVEMAMERFKFLHMMEPEDRELLVLDAVDEWIDMLYKTGEITDEDEQLMRNNPAIVADSEEFRNDLLAKRVKRAMRDAVKGNVADDEGD